MTWVLEGQINESPILSFVIFILGYFSFFYIKLGVVEKLLFYGKEVSSSYHMPYK